MFFLFFHVYTVYDLYFASRVVFVIQTVVGAADVPCDDYLPMQTPRSHERAKRPSIKRYCVSIRAAID